MNGLYYFVMKDGSIVFGCDNECEWLNLNLDIDQIAEAYYGNTKL